MRKKFTNHCARIKNNSQEAEESKDCKFRTYRQCHKSYDDSCSRPNKIMKTPALRRSKYYTNTGSFRHHNNCGSTHPSMAASEENKLPPSFLGFKPQKFLHESSYDWVSGTDNDEQSLTTQQVSFTFGCSKRSPDLKTAVYFL